jgi:hypothetical protein
MLPECANCAAGYGARSRLREAHGIRGFQRIPGAIQGVISPLLQLLVLLAVVGILGVICISLFVGQHSKAHSTIVGQHKKAHSTVVGQHNKAHSTIVSSLSTFGQDLFTGVPLDRAPGNVLKVSAADS